MTTALRVAQAIFLNCAHGPLPARLLHIARCHRNEGLPR
ncbi:hypothetical protein PXO_02950 [Xanthomonas oryzae pv. oryzae PXO99A]|uniref:Uncharacterized protein n=1 Tax=Xanthomonas oryzae pv. oryzae (strain PXO99A) TaxID=360094 RepID=A0A0K0GQQ2_XANOP|nr:hypothetical protein PXO_02950 [Xanthomonas oryzae pv. oryzae PXO99A]